MDELNGIQSYFDGLDYTEKQLKSRTNMAEDMLEYVFFMYALMKSMTDYYLVASLMADKYIEIASRYVEIGLYIQNHAEKVSQELIENTINNDSEYFTSNRRAVSIACNEAMFCINNEEYQNAVKSGKKSKLWDDVKDDRERPTHRVIGGSIVDINEPFRVGDSLMMFPKDESLGAKAEEIINCRCTIQYL